MKKLSLVDCVAWCQSKVDASAEAGNFQDWNNYNQLLELWKQRAETGDIK